MKDAMLRERSRRQRKRQVWLKQEHSRVGRALFMAVIATILIVMFIGLAMQGCGLW